MKINLSFKNEEVLKFNRFARSLTNYLIVSNTIYLHIGGAKPQDAGIYRFFTTRTVPANI